MNKASYLIFGKNEPEKDFAAISKIEKKFDLKNIRGARILLVEDDKINQQVATEILEHEGFIVTTVDNGIEAVKAVVKVQFDVVLMDVQMPLMDGYDATKQIRKLNSDVCNIPIIAMTAHAIKDEREKCLQTGMNDYLTKPIEVNQLFLTLLKWIEHKKRKIPVFTKNYSEKSLDFDFSNIKGIDIESGLKKIFNNKTVYRKILIDFHTKYEKIGQKIKKHYADGDFLYCGNKSHAIKGVAGNIGAIDLYKIASELEACFKKHEFDNVVELMDSFEKQLDLIHQSIAELKKPEVINKKKESQKNTISIDKLKVEPSKVIDLFKKLSELIQIGDLEAETILNEIRDYLKNTSVEKHLNQIKEQIDNFDFHGAQKTLNTLTENIGKFEKWNNITRVI